MLESADAAGPAAPGGGRRVGGIGGDLGTALTQLSRDLWPVARGVLQVVAIALVAVLVARLLQSRVLARLRRTGIDANVVTLGGNLAVIGVYALGFAASVSLLGGNWGGIVAVLGAGTVAVTLALQDVLRGVVAGVYLLIERPFAIGDRIEVKGVEGSVEAIDLRTTTLRTDAAGRVFVPNATVFSEIVANRSAGTAAATVVTLARIVDDPGRAAARAAAALAGMDGVRGDPRLDRVALGPDGAEVVLTLHHDRGAAVAPELSERLRAAFPDASMVVERARP